MIIPKPMPIATQIADQIAASFAEMTWASRWAKRSMASMTTITPRTASQIVNGTSITCSTLFRCLIHELDCTYRAGFCHEVQVVSPLACC